MLTDVAYIPNSTNILSFRRLNKLGLQIDTEKLVLYIRQYKLKYKLNQDRARQGQHAQQLRARQEQHAQQLRARQELGFVQFHEAHEAGGQLAGRVFIIIS